MDYKEIAEKFFADDLYATKLSGIVIDEVEPGYAKCRMEITDNHKNANGVAMGGAVFTLADFTCSVAANCTALESPKQNVVSLSANINFLSPGKGPVLYCEAKSVKSGRATSLYEARITDSDGRLVAFASMTGFNINK